MESVSERPRRRARRTIAAVVLAVVGACALSACQPADHSNAQARRPDQAGQPMNPYTLAAHAAGARASMALGDSRAAQKHIDAVAHDLSRSMRLPDATRPIDHEAARAAVRTLPGVRTAVWLDKADRKERKRRDDVVVQLPVAGIGAGVDAGGGCRVARGLGEV